MVNAKRRTCACVFLILYSARALGHFDACPSFG